MITIQNQIDNMLRIALNGASTTPSTTNIIGNLRFLKAELQRGKNKIVEDDEAVKVLVQLYKSQAELMTKIALIDSSVFSEKDESRYNEASNLMKLIASYLPDNVVSQINCDEGVIKLWIENNIDMAQIKNKNQIIGIVKKQLPYVDGNLVKTVVETL